MLTEKHDSFPKNDISPKEQTPGLEQFEHFFNAFLNDLLEQHAEKINEGNNGVIFRLDLKGIDPRILEILRQQGIDFGSEQAAKVLRFSRPGEGMKEFGLQSLAYEIVEKEKGKEIAHIPRPIACREIEVTQTTYNKLERAGVRMEGRRVEIQIMDIIPGEDLATILYKEVVRNHSSTIHLTPQLDTLTFSELHEAVSDALGFSLPGGRARDEQERAFEERKVLTMNAEKIYRFLSHKNVRLHPSISRQIRGCMDALHQGGIAHRDAHHRNIMVQGDYRADGTEPPKAWVIDFGSAIKFQGEYSPNVLQGEVSSGAIKYINDELVARDLEIHFSKTFEQHISEEQNKQLNELISLHEKLLRTAAGKAHLEQAEKMNEASNFELLLIRSPNPKLPCFLLLLQEGVSLGTVTANRVREFLSQKKATSIPADNRLIDAVIASLEKD